MGLLFRTSDRTIRQCCRNCTKLVAGHSGAAKEAANEPYKVQRPLIAQHASAALRLVQGMHDVDSDRVAAIGYCFGGKVVLDLARTGADIKAAVSFHGVLDRLGVPVFGPQKSQSSGPVKPKIVVFHGYADPFTPPEQLHKFMEELEALGAQYEVRVSGSAVLHGFTREEKSSEEDKRMGMQYNERVAKRAWASTLNLLQETLG